MQVTPVDPRPLMGREGNPAALASLQPPQTISDLLNYMKDTDRMVAKLCDSDSDSTPPSKRSGPVPDTTEWAFPDSDPPTFCRAEATASCSGLFSATASST